MGYFVLAVLAIIAVTVSIVYIIKTIKENKRRAQFDEINTAALQVLRLSSWKYTNVVDAVIRLKSSSAVDNYSEIKYFKENREAINEADRCLKSKEQYSLLLSGFLKNNELKDRPMYSELEQQLKNSLHSLYTYNIMVTYTSPAGRSSRERVLRINRQFLDNIKSDPSLIMGKAEYNRFLKEQNKDALNQKLHTFYEMINDVIDLANDKRDNLVIENDKKELDRLISSLIDKTVNNIKKIKSLDSDEWGVIKKIITNIKQDTEKIVKRNQEIIDYYDSDDFCKIKETCNSLIESQKDFNEYINEKAQSIANLFGSKIVRNETVNNDEYNYIRPYQKSITPFTAEVSSAVFASAENNPIDYIIKYFYPNKAQYPEQIQKLQLLI